MINCTILNKQKYFHSCWQFIHIDFVLQFFFHFHMSEEIGKQSEAHVWVMHHLSNNYHYKFLKLLAKYPTSTQFENFFWTKNQTSNIPHNMGSNLVLNSMGLRPFTPPLKTYCYLSSGDLHFLASFPSPFLLIELFILGFFPFHVVYCYLTFINSFQGMICVIFNSLWSWLY